MDTREKMPIPEFGTRQDGIDYLDRPGVYAIIGNFDQQIAVIRTSGGYFLPGGGIDPGESDFDALKREIREEIGYQITSVREIGEVIEYIRANDENTDYRIPSRFYRVKLGAKIVEGNEKDHRLEWLSKENAIQLLCRQGQAWIIQTLAAV